MKVQKLDWKSFEQLAERIYRKLTPDSVVTPNDFIFGHESEKRRQIDVSIRSTIAGHEILSIVQARCRKRPPNINDVGEFAAVIRDVRACKGIMVCLKPPGKNALRLAKTYNIDLCTAIDAADRRWSDDVTVPVVVTLVEGTLSPSFTFFRQPGAALSLQLDPSPKFVSYNEGKSRISLLEYMARLVADNGAIETDNRILVVQDSQLLILLGDHNWVPLPHLEVETSATVRKVFRHCKPQEYLALRNHSTGKLSVAEMKIELPPFSDSKAWHCRESIEPYENVVERIPVVDFQLTATSQGSRYGLRILPEKEISSMTSDETWQMLREAKNGPRYVLCPAIR